MQAQSKGEPVRVASPCGGPRDGSWRPDRSTANEAAHEKPLGGTSSGHAGHVQARAGTEYAVRGASAAGSASFFTLNLSLGDFKAVSRKAGGAGPVRVGVEKTGPIIAPPEAWASSAAFRSFCAGRPTSRIRRRWSCTRALLSGANCVWKIPMATRCAKSPSDRHRWWVRRSGCGSDEHLPLMGKKRAPLSGRIQDTPEVSREPCEQPYGSMVSRRTLRCAMSPARAGAGPYCSQPPVQTAVGSCTPTKT